jgi:hypothetical protein
LPEEGIRNAIMIKYWMNRRAAEASTELLAYGDRNNRRWMATLASLLSLLLIIGSAVPALAYDVDTHYLLTYYLARKVGYSPDQAQRIASADESMDTDPNVKPAIGLGSPDNQAVLRNFHAFLDNGLPSPDEQQAAQQAQADALWDQAVATKNVGQYLHFLQDEYAHEGFTDILGHLLYGHAPDALGSDLDKSWAMAQATVAALQRFAPEVGVTPQDVDLLDDSEAHDVVVQLAEASPAPDTPADTIVKSLPDPMPLSTITSITQLLTEMGLEGLDIPTWTPNLDAAKAIISDELGEAIPDVISYQFAKDGTPLSSSYALTQPATAAQPSGDVGSDFDVKPSDTTVAQSGVSNGPQSATTDTGQSPATNTGDGKAAETSDAGKGTGNANAAGDDFTVKPSGGTVTQNGSNGGSANSAASAGDGKPTTDPQRGGSAAQSKPGDAPATSTAPAATGGTGVHESDGTVKQDGQGIAPAETAGKPPQFAAGLYNIVFGDTHLTSFDGVHFDFQAVGEFVLFKSTTDDLQVQIRQQPYGSSNTISIATAVSMNVAGNRVAIYLKHSPKLMIDGSPITAQVGTTHLSSGGQVRFASDQFEVVWPDGSAVHVDASHGHIDVLANLAAPRKGHVAGLLGDWNGDPTNDFTARDRTAIPISTIYGTSRQIYTVFGDSWRIGQSDSLFVYAPGESTDSFSKDRQFPHSQVSAATLDAPTHQMAERTCRGAGLTDGQFLDDCILDVGQTNDQSFASGAAAASAASKPIIATAGPWTGVWTGKIVLVDNTGCHLTEAQSSRDISISLTQSGSQVTGSAHWTAGRFSSSCALASTVASDLTVSGTDSNGQLVGQTSDGFPVTLTRFSSNAATGKMGPGVPVTLTKAN